MATYSLWGEGGTDGLAMPAERLAMGFSSDTEGTRQPRVLLGDGYG